MRALHLSTVALAWLAACGPGSNANRTSGTDGAGGDHDIGMTGDTVSGGRGGAGTGMDTGIPVPSGRGMADSVDAAAILTMLSTANKQEIQEAKYARSHASSDAVKSLARKLEADHTANLQKARQLAKALGVSQRLPSDTASATAAPSQLQGLQGAALDSAFVADQIEAHQANVDRIREQMIPAAKNAQLKQYLQQTLTAMEGHLRQAQQVQRQLGHS